MSRKLRLQGRALARKRPRLRAKVRDAHRAALSAGASDVDACAAAHVCLAESLGVFVEAFSEGFVAEALGVAL
mgnify:CR=1 FL=1